MLNAQGLWYLLENGFIPRNADVTPALLGRTGVLHQRRMRLHEFKEQHAHTMIASGPIAPVLNLKLDLNPAPATARVGPANVVKPRSQFHFKAASLLDDDESVAVDQFAVTIEGKSRQFAINKSNEAAAEARGFDELLDTYSLHEFIIRNGVTVTSTPEFASFQRCYSHFWGAVLSELV